MGHDWYRQAVIYELDVETFQDGNGDGVGDFLGLTRRLDYLVALGVTCLWLLPIYPTPNRDNGYDVTDYCAVDPRLGTLADFRTFLRAATERGLRVLLDLPINDTSDQHPWFRAARQGPHNPYFDYYVWREQPPGHDERAASFGGPAWTYDPSARRYYHHAFYPFQPDLNVENPRVRAKFHAILRFWLEFGIAGFRMDAVPALIHQPGLPRPFGVLRDLHAHVRALRPDAALLGEVDAPPDELARYFGHGPEDAHLDLLLNFDLCANVFLALARGRAQSVVEAWGRLPTPPAFGRYANFLRNNDELNLDRLTPPQRAQVFAAFAPQPDMRAYGRGVRRRLASMLMDLRQWRLAYSLLMSMPGAPVLYYGEEIGMGDDLSLSERNSVRTVMQWDASPGGGFSTAPPATFPRGLISAGPFGHQRVNVAGQQRDPDSPLNFMRRLLRVRRALPALGEGVFEALDVGNASVLAHRCAGGPASVLALHNLSAQAQTVSLPLADRSARLVWSDGPSIAVGGPVELGPYGFRWFQEV